jgi:hypothetical protein
VFLRPEAPAKTVEALQQQQQQQVSRQSMISHAHAQGDQLHRHTCTAASVTLLLGLRVCADLCCSCCLCDPWRRPQAAYQIAAAQRPQQREPTRSQHVVGSTSSLSRLRNARAQRCAARAAKTCWSEAWRPARLRLCFRE